MLKVSHGKSNTFMIFGMLLLGFFLIFLILIGDIFNNGSLLKQVTSKIDFEEINSKSIILFTPIVIITLYSIGFTIYLSSFIFLSAPSWYAMKLIYKDKLFTSEFVFDMLLPTSPNYDFLKMKVFYLKEVFYISYFEIMKAI